MLAFMSSCQSHVAPNYHLKRQSSGMPGSPSNQTMFLKTLSHIMEEIYQEGGVRRGTGAEVIIQCRLSER